MDQKTDIGKQSVFAIFSHAETKYLTAKIKGGKVYFSLKSVEDSVHNHQVTRQGDIAEEKHFMSGKRQQKHISSQQQETSN